MKEYSIIGKRFPRLDARDKVTGQAQYTADIALPNMLYGKIPPSANNGSKILETFNILLPSIVMSQLISLIASPIFDCYSQRQYLKLLVHLFDNPGGLWYKQLKMA